MIKPIFENIYLTPEVVEEMKNSFEGNGYLQLLSVFKNFPKIKSKLLNCQLEIKPKFNPLEYKFSEISLTNQNIDQLLFIEFFKSEEFISFVEEITQFELFLQKISFKKFSVGDYTLLNDKQIYEETLKVIIDLSDDWKKEYGGSIIFTTQTEEVFYLDGQGNSLTILYSPKELMNYTKYINNLAKDKNIFRIEIDFSISE